MKKYIIIIVAVILLSVINILFINHRLTNFQNDGSLPDTITNTVRIDSIVLSIKHKDTIVNNLKFKADEEIQQAINDSNNDAVKRFINLVCN